MEVNRPDSTSLSPARSCPTQLANTSRSPKQRRSTGIGNDRRLHFLAVRFRHELANGALVGSRGEDSLCTGPVGCTRRRGPRPLRSRIKRRRYWGWGCRRYRWKQRGKERQKGLYWEFIQKLEGAHGPRARGFRNFQMSTVRHLANIRPLSLPAPRPVSGSSQGMHALGAVRLSRASSSASATPGSPRSSRPRSKRRSCSR